MGLRDNGPRNYKTTDHETMGQQDKERTEDRLKMSAVIGQGKTTRPRDYETTEKSEH
jgi:hypothetical protein